MPELCVALQLAALFGVAVVVVDGVKVVSALARDVVDKVLAVVGQVLGLLRTESEALGATTAESVQIVEDEGLVGPRIVYSLDDAIIGGDVTSDLLLG